ncbi:MAG: caspase family protein [Myxococcota bacterium]|nr:caspase family protein [Myxococcota bacterium]
MSTRAAFRGWALLCAAASAIAPTTPARAEAEEAAPATFALIIGSNASVDAELPALKYADDDAALYLDLFRLLGARTYLLSRLDDNTRRLHPQAAAEAMEPRRTSLASAFAMAASDVAQARDRGLQTVFYFVYAGHGNVKNGVGYITLEDARLTGSDLAQMFAAVPAARVHVIADACASYYLAYSRGPGGERMPIRGLPTAPELVDDPRVGLLLSTSSARESHEWEAFQAGVFSHEVRSGLYGAADADNDGRVTYREIAAFVNRANAAVPNDRFRPDVHAKPPGGSDTLLDLRRNLGRRIEIDGAHAAHYWVEDGLGVRLADFHNDAGQSVHVLRPAPNGRVYLRRTADDTEFVVPALPDVISLVDIAGMPVRVASRGAASEAFEKLFSLPFNRGVVQTYSDSASAAQSAPDPPRDSGAWRSTPGASTGARLFGWGALAFGTAALGTGGILSLSSIGVSHGVAPNASQRDVAASDARISALNTGAAVAYAAGGVSLAAGAAALLFWPRATSVQAVALPSGGYLRYAQSF